MNREAPSMSSRSPSDSPHNLVGGTAFARQRVNQHPIIAPSASSSPSSWSNLSSANSPSFQVEQGSSNFFSLSLTQPQAHPSTRAQISLPDHQPSPPDHIRSPSSKPTLSARNEKRSSSACVPCRKRKRKCDGIKPICGSCQNVRWDGPFPKPVFLLNLKGLE
ncbi:hypothetical protein IE53DRAFT_113887 [Violaceomyces palustris]|uniref:Uncharacterized protein n=1 Tax=Violaceomyces palustris TaxID=1673888 RepID=A0ACD0NW49_9BASI|nr:hypothetical protein IE53DRAFT_113887 [Violaceomyces palustris]